MSDEEKRRRSKSGEPPCFYNCDLRKGAEIARRPTMRLPAASIVGVHVGIFISFAGRKELTTTIKMFQTRIPRSHA